MIWNKPPCLRTNWWVKWTAFLSNTAASPLIIPINKLNTYICCLWVRLSEILLIILVYKVNLKIWKFENLKMFFFRSKKKYYWIIFQRSWKTIFKFSNFQIFFSHFQITLNLFLQLSSKVKLQVSIEQYQTRGKNYRATQKGSQ